MKKTNIRTPIVTDRKTTYNYLIGGFALTVAYLVINANPFGIFNTLLLLQSVLSADVIIGYILYTGIILLVMTVITGLVLKSRKINASAPTAFVAVAILHFIAGVVLIYAPANIFTTVGIVYILAVGAVFAAINIINRIFIQKQRLAVVIGVAIALICVQPFIINPLSARYNARVEDKARAAISIDLDFKVYYPTAEFPDYAIIKPFTENYPDHEYRGANPNVTFYIGKNIKVQQGAMPPEQSKLMNYVDACDVDQLNYAFLYDNSRPTPVDSAQSCVPAFVTPSGKKVYKSDQPAIYFVQMGDTDIFFEWEYNLEAGPSRYSEYEPTVLKAIDSLEEIDQSTVTLGYDATY